MKVRDLRLRGRPRQLQVGRKDGSTRNPFDPLGPRKRRLLNLATSALSRIFGVYIFWDTDGERFEQTLHNIQEAGSPQHVYNWND